ncbi:MAG: hypothetical protein VB814_13255, partial [Pirellulaceae bacterium]
MFKLTKKRYRVFSQSIFPTLAVVVVLVSGIGRGSNLWAAESVELVRNGHSVAVRSVLAIQLAGDAWKTSTVGPDKVSVFQGAGQGARLVAGVNVPTGDFKIRARLRMVDQEKSAAG